MEPAEKEKLGKLLGKGYIERKIKRQVIKGREDKDEALIDVQKVTGLDDKGGIADAELDRIQVYDCGDPSEGRPNFGGVCQICGATFCNKTREDRPSCYRRCIYCHKKICMNHVRGKPGDPVYCSLKCYFFDHPLLLWFLFIGGFVFLWLVVSAILS